MGYPALMAREDGVREIKAVPEGLYAIADRDGLVTSFMIPWDEVPRDVREHMVAVFKHLNGINDTRLILAAEHVKVEDMRRVSRRPWISEVVCTCGQRQRPPEDHGAFCPIYKATHA